MFAEFGPLYRALTVVGVPPTVADELEVWQVADVLGLARGEGDAGESELTGDALLRERVRRARAGQPQPTTRQAPVLDARLAGLARRGGQGAGDRA